ncbi:transposase [Rhodococcus koreensis]|uniref:transposase n=1 Tax=Rhodococcus koreensis TaxID=99653 RepID=UPI0036DE197B
MLRDHHHNQRGGSQRDYKLVTTLLDPDCPATKIVRLYQDRWGIETAFLELKSTILGGRVLRARAPRGVEPEIYALLVTNQCTSAS